MDRAEFIRSLHVACREARELGARYAIDEATEQGEQSGLHWPPAAADGPAESPAAAASAESDETDEMTPRAVYREPEVFERIGH